MTKLSRKPDNAERAMPGRVALAWAQRSAGVVLLSILFVVA